MSEDKGEEETYLSMPKLKSRGWTKSMVNKFLGEEDIQRANPFYRSAAPMKLYLEKRVEKIEKTEAFVAAKKLAEERSKKAKARAQKKKEDLLEEVSKNVELKVISLKKLRRLAIKHKREWDAYIQDMYGHYDDGDPSLAEERHIKRWMVNYARHELSNYESVREDYAGQVGVQVAAERVRNMVLDKIAEAWPELSDACTNAKRCRNTVR